MSRVNVSFDRELYMEELEDLAGEPLTDDAWNALARLSKRELSAVSLWLNVANRTRASKVTDTLALQLADSPTAAANEASWPTPRRRKS